VELVKKNYGFKKKSRGTHEEGEGEGFLLSAGDSRKGLDFRQGERVPLS